LYFATFSLSDGQFPDCTFGRALIRPEEAEAPEEAARLALPAEVQVVAEVVAEVAAVEPG
jgi:hypothetical protein